MSNGSQFSGYGQHADFDGHQVLSLLSSRYGVQVRGGEIRLPCPAYGGSNKTSLKFSVSKDGSKLLAYCHSNECSFEEIAQALERDTGIRVSASKRNPVPDPRSGGRSGENYVEHRYVYRRGPERVTQVDRRYSGPCGRDDCAERGSHKHQWRDPGGVGGSEWELLLHEPAKRAGAAVPVIAEGEKTCAAVAEVGYPAYSYLGGSSGADKADYGALADAPLVLVAPDRDEAGAKAALSSVVALLSLSPPVAAVRLLDAKLLPGFRGADMADVSTERRLELLRGLTLGDQGTEYCTPALPVLELAELDYARRVARLPGSERVAIAVTKNSELLDFAETAWGAMTRLLCAPGCEQLFQRGEKQLVEVGVKEGKRRRDGSIANTSYIQPVDARRLGPLSCKAIMWHKPKPRFKRLAASADDGSDDALLELAALLRATEPQPHSWVGRKSGSKIRGGQYGIWSREPSWPLKEGLDYLMANVPGDIPPLERVLRAPVLSPDGSELLAQPGYHRAVSAWIAPSGGVDPAALPPVQECLSRIWEVFGGFPFATDGDRSSLLALLLAGIVGPACGPKPAFLGDKSTPGTGATLMMRTAAALVGGVTPYWLPARKSRDADAELEKALITASLSGNPFVFYDNATGRLNSPVLNSYLTSEVWGGRKLGGHDEASVDRTTLVDMISGNNLLTTPDTERRVLPVYLDAKVADPRGGYSNSIPWSGCFRTAAITWRPWWAWCSTGSTRAVRRVP